MQTIELGGGLRVTPVCLGTMTFGQQNSEAEGHAQLDYALAQGITFIDTAEMYPVPARAETSGRTEAIVGSWLRGQRRDAIQLATKAAGPGRGMGWIRDGALGFSAANLQRALDGSLRRLGTDYVDLYQLHWPDRNAPLFGQAHFDPTLERDTVPLAQTVLAIGELIRSGRVRHWGLSNETPWGLMRCLQLADALGVPRPVSVQNAYSLLNRNWEGGGLAEIGFRERVGLLAYSPLGFGVLSGKYHDDPAAAGRINLFGGFGQRYAKPNVAEAVAAYVALARSHGLTPAQLALRFVGAQWCVASTIVGATTLAQLRDNIEALREPLSAALRADIDAIHQRFPNPAP